MFGGVVAADARLTAGGVLLDQCMLTGESVPIEAGPGLQTFAGALVRRGEAVPEVTATGASTKFGRTAELVPHRPCRQFAAKGGLARGTQIYVSFAGCVIVVLAVYAVILRLPAAAVVPLANSCARLNSGRSAGDVHPCGGDRREDAREIRRASNASLGAR